MSSLGEQTKMSIDEENESLRNDIVEQLRSPDCEFPENILLIGKTGAGKSALINTLHKVLTGKYYAVATQGSGGKEQSVSIDLLRYENCGVLLHRISDKKRKETMTDILQKLPHFYDCAGLANQNSLELQEILELLFGGYIQPGTSMDALVRMQEEYGTGRLKKIFKNQYPSMKVSKVVFMHGSIDADIPKNLIECVREVLRMYDPNTLVRKYQCKIFILITKYDLVCDSDEKSFHGRTSGEKSVTYEEFKSIENSIAEGFSVVGALESHTSRWVSHTDDIGYNNPEVDKIALTFLKKIIEPGLPKAVAATPVFDSCYWFELFMYRCLNNRLQKMRLGLVIAVSFAVCIFAFFYRMLKANF